MRSARTLLAAAALVLSGGCMTFDHLIDQQQRLAMYGGTKSTYHYLERDTSPFVGSVIRLIDWPATAVMDTLILPIVAPIVLNRGRQREFVPEDEGRVDPDDESYDSDP